MSGSRASGDKLGRNAYGARVAGGRGYGLISANFVPAVNVASHWQIYREGAAEAGRAVEPGNWRWRAACW